ncbi:MAG: transglycosylase SLT domain-containing protein [Fibromonadaceae bacterium]|jgi:soluble lytic murein transglycosylase|nr:transglycosylase SLT domain-containing protein [Fibromonadaceae bacterium]
MRFSVLHLILVCIAMVLFLFYAFAKWQSKNEQVKVLNNEILLMQAKIASAEEQGTKALAYARIIRGLDILAGRKLSARQKSILTERLFQISSDYKIDPLLILAVIKHESRGNPNARGAFISGAESGALGLMQIKYESALDVARYVGVRLNSPEDLFNPEINLMVGTAYLLRLIAKYQNLQHALIAYNIGLGTLDGKLRSGERLPMRYYNKVMQEYRLLAERIFE